MPWGWQQMEFERIDYRECVLSRCLSRTVVGPETAPRQQSGASLGPKWCWCQYTAPRRRTERGVIGLFWTPGFLIINCDSIIVTILRWTNMSLHAIQRDGGWKLAQREETVFISEMSASCFAGTRKQAILKILAPVGEHLEMNGMAVDDIR